MGIPDTKQIKSSSSQTQIYPAFSLIRNMVLKQGSCGNKERERQPG